MIFEPAMGRASVPSIERRKSCPLAMYTNRAPSGEIAISWRPTLVNCWPSGSASGNRITAAGGEGFKFHAAMLVRTPTTIAVTRTGMARLQRGCRSAACGARPETIRGSAAILSSSQRRSPAACQRRFGFFSKHRRIRSGILEFRSGGRAVRSGSRARTDARTSDAVSP